MAAVSLLGQHTMSFRSVLFGKPLRSDSENKEQIGPVQGIPVLGLDALASASYGPEAALTVLLLAGPGSSGVIVPISGCIIGLLLMVYFSYRQTIAAYPNGGGSFTVANDNLGANAGFEAPAERRRNAIRMTWRSNGPKSSKSCA
jgi:amino acid transporter